MIQSSYSNRLFTVISCLYSSFLSAVLCNLSTSNLSKEEKRETYSNLHQQLFFNGWVLSKTDYTLQVNPSWNDIMSVWKMVGFILPPNHLSEGNLSQVCQRSLCCLHHLHNNASGLCYYLPYDWLISSRNPQMYYLENCSSLEPFQFNNCNQGEMSCIKYHWAGCGNNSTDICALQ